MEHVASKVYRIIIPYKAQIMRPPLRIKKIKELATDKFFEGDRNSLDEGFPDEGFGRVLEFDQIGEKFGGKRRLYGNQDIFGLSQRRQLYGQIAVVVGLREESERLLSRRPRHGNTIRLKLRACVRVFL